MDPNATYQIMTAADSDIEEAAVAATDLLVWVCEGGYLPGDRQTIGARNKLLDACRYHIFRALDRLDELEGS